MRRFGATAIAALALCTGRAEAQFDHRLVAQSGPGCSETTQDLDVDSLDVPCESGVIGVDPNSFSNRAVVDSATGDLNVTAQLSFEEPPGSFDPGSLDTIATIQERLTRTGLGPIRATLQFSSGLDIFGTVVDYEVTLRLTNACTAFFSQTAGNGSLGDPSSTANCPGGSASADLNTLSVTLESPVTTIDLLAQIRAEWLFAYDLGGQYQIDGDLRVDALGGASFSAPSPNFLTQVPEPQASLAGFTVFAALGRIARKRS